MGSLSWDTQLAWDFLLRLFWPTLRERRGFLLIATQAAKKAETRHVNYEFQRVRHNCCNLLGGFKFLVLFHTDPNICQDSERNCGFETTNQWWIDSEGPEFVTWFRGIFSMNARPPAAVFSKSLATLALRSERLEPCGIVWKLVRKNPFHSTHSIHWLIIIFWMKVAILGYTAYMAYISIPYFQTNPCACLWNVKPIDILWTNWRSLRHTPGNVAVQAGHLSRVASQTDDGFSGKPWLEHLLENTLRHEGDTARGGRGASFANRLAPF